MPKETVARLTGSSALAWLFLPMSAAHAHGLSPALVWMLFGALAVHLAAPVFLLASSRFRGQRRRIFGGYAVIMTTYYIVMWVGGIAEMFIFPIIPVFLVILFYFTVRLLPDQS